MSIRIIKKYKNRRLYDTSTNSYITLEDVKQLVFKHVEFKVIDASSDKDLTQSTLLQIITEQETSSTPIFTNSMLCDFIRSYQQESQSMFRDYLARSMDLFTRQNELFLQQLQSIQSAFATPHDRKKSDKPNDSENNK